VTEEALIDAFNNTLFLTLKMASAVDEEENIIKFNSAEGKKIKLSPFLTNLFGKEDSYIMENNDALSRVDVSNINILIRVECSAVEPQVYGNEFKQYIGMILLESKNEIYYVCFPKINFIKIAKHTMTAINIKIFTENDQLLNCHPSDKTMVVLFLRQSI